LGGLLIGLSAALIPGIGPVLAAGPLAAALGGLAGAGVGALAGGVAGGLLGVLGSMGVPEERARLYTEAVRRGGVLVTVHAEDYTLAEQARDILQAQGAIDIKERVAEWQKTGWNESDRHKPDWQETSSLEGFSDDIFVPYDMNELAEEETSSRVSGTSPLEDRLSDETATEEADEVIQEPVEEDEAGTSHYYAAEYPDDFYRYSHTFREHYRAYLSGSDHDYSFYQPAYYVAYQIFNDGRYRDSDWGEVEPEVRTRWERENPGTWDEFERSFVNVKSKRADQFQTAIESRIWYNQVLGFRPLS
jgi:site-specific DNA-cytosine methylase